MRKQDGTHSIIQRTVPLRASATSELQSKHARVILSQVIVVLQSMLLNAENIRSKSSHPFNPHLHRNAPPLAAQKTVNILTLPRKLFEASVGDRRPSARRHVAESGSRTLRSQRTPTCEPCGRRGLCPGSDRAGTSGT